MELYDSFMTKNMVSEAWHGVLQIVVWVWSSESQIFHPVSQPSPKSTLAYILKGGERSWEGSHRMHENHTGWENYLYWMQIGREVLPREEFHCQHVLWSCTPGSITCKQKLFKRCKQTKTDPFNLVLQKKEQKGICLRSLHWFTHITVCSSWN